MKKIVISLLIICLIGSFASCAEQKGSGKMQDLQVPAKEFVTMLSNGNFEAASAQFDDTVKSAMPASRLQELWQQLNAQMGQFKKIKGTRAAEIAGYQTVYVTCKFEKSDTALKLVYDSSGKIAGLWFVSAQESENAKPPAYIKRSAFIEKNITVGSGEWKLPGTLSMPKGKGPFPALVLVHGSGPNDRDETLGPNKPFRDLAWGLASSGIAVLRYDKRTRVHPIAMASLDNITVKEEIIDDAVFAVQLLRKTKGIDANRVFVLGHSLSGMLIPRIGKAEPDIHGLIVMAGAAQPIEDALLEQLRYMESLGGPGTEQIKSQISVIEQQVAQIKSKNLTKDTPGLLIGAPSSYWLDLRGYNPLEAAKALKQPVFIIQGARDYQVRTAEFERWKSALSNKRSVQLKLYPGLNHLFIEGEGRSTPAEYEIPGHVAGAVISDIANWIKKH